MTTTCVINGEEIDLQLIVEDEEVVFLGGAEHKQQMGQEAEEEIPTLDVDKWGFFIELNSSDQFHKALAIPPSVRRQREEKEKERLQKWLDMRRGWNDSKPPSKAKERCRKGVPNKARTWAWYQICRASRFDSTFPAVLPEIGSPEYASLNEVLCDEIDRDIPRTFPRHRLFYPKKGAGQSSLRRLLRCYALHDPEVGYCQGMGFIAGMMLSYMDERNALSTFIAALSGPSSRNPHLLQFQLREMYLPSMAGAQRCLYVYEALGRKYLGKLWAHLEAEGMHPTMYATEWMMTIFTRGFNFDLVTRVWDIFLEEDFKIVYRVALALVKVHGPVPYLPPIGHSFTPNPNLYTYPISRLPRTERRSTASRRAL
jgi:TBC1 domain family member 10